MTVRILCRVAGRKDVVLTLQPGHYEHIAFGGGAIPPDIAFLLLEDSTGVLHGRMHIDEQRPPVVEQLGLDQLAGGAG